MIIAISQPTFLPWSGYIALIDYVHEFIFLDNVQFDKRSWQQRNNIKTSEGTQTITIPAGETVNAVFDVKPSSESFNRFAISVEIGDADADYIDESIDDFDFKEDTIIDDPEETSAWFMLVIIILTLLVAYGGLKVAKNKGSTRF